MWRIKRFLKILHLTHEVEPSVAWQESWHTDNRCVSAMRYRKGLIDENVGFRGKFSGELIGVRFFPRIIAQIRQEFHSFGHEFLQILNRAGFQMRGKNYASIGR